MALQTEAEVVLKDLPVTLCANRAMMEEMGFAMNQSKELVRIAGLGLIAQVDNLNTHRVAESARLDSAMDVTKGKLLRSRAKVICVVRAWRLQTRASGLLVSRCARLSGGSLSKRG